MTRFLTVDHVVAIHNREVGAGVRDRGLLESAVGRPQQTFDGEDLYPSLHNKAGALFESLAQNQPFLDGNKRTALLSAYAFYALNGWQLEVPDDYEVIHLAVDLALGNADAAKCAERFSEWARPIPDPHPDQEAVKIVPGRRGDWRGRARG